MSIRVDFRWSEELLASVDEARGDVSRSVWVRRAVERALENVKREESAFLSAKEIVAEPEHYHESVVANAREIVERSRVRSSADARRGARAIPKGSA